MYSAQRVPVGRATGYRVMSSERGLGRGCPVERVIPNRERSVSAVAAVATVVVEVAAKPMQQLFVISTLNTIGVVEMRFTHSR